MRKMWFLCQFNFSQFHSEQFSGVPLWEETPTVNALFHAAVGLCVLTKAYARNPGGLKKMFLMYVCYFLAYIYIFQLNLSYLHSNQTIRKYELCKICELEPIIRGVISVLWFMSVGHDMVNFLFFHSEHNTCFSHHIWSWEHLKGYYLVIIIVISYCSVILCPTYCLSISIVGDLLILNKPETTLK